jgi:hypothetical protein
MSYRPSWGSTQNLRNVTPLGGSSIDIRNTLDYGVSRLNYG